MPLLATTGAFVFAAQMLNFPIGFGTSGHFMGAAAVAALLGPWRSCLVMTLVLLIQALVFGDGGISALGTNIFNMAVVASFGAYLVMRLLRRLLPAGRNGYLMAVAVASWASVVLAALACSIELAASGTSPLWWVLPAMVGTHAVIGIGEACITFAVLSAVLAARPDIVAPWANVLPGCEQRLGLRSTWGVALGGLVLSLMLALLISPWASASPDGLEKVAERQQFAEQGEGPAVWQGSLLPDYSVPGMQNERVSTGISGLLGTVALFAIGFCAFRALSLRVTEE
jgi:cobalt/nickel transport system permease protein